MQLFQKCKILEHLQYRCNMEKVRTVVDGLHRDTSSHALVSVDVDGYKLYKQNRKQHLTLQTLDTEMRDIKQQLNILMKLVNKNTDK